MKNTYKIINTPISDKQYKKNREQDYFVKYAKSGELYKDAQELADKGYKVKIYYVRTSVQGYYDTIIMYKIDL